MQAKRKPLTLLACTLSVLIPIFTHAQKMPEPLAQSTQLIVVTTPMWDYVDGVLQRYERTSPTTAWKPVGPAIPIVVGKHGLGWGSGIDTGLRQDPTEPVKQEGDGRAPAGLFTLGTAFGAAPQPLPGTRLPYHPLTPATDCVDDPTSSAYNSIVERTPTSTWTSAEHMRSVGDAYRWGVVVNHNTPKPTPGRGSCIFLHIWKGEHAADRGTAGCTAMPQAALETILQWLDPKRQPLLLQLPATQYASFLIRWKVPTTFDPQDH